MQFPAPSAQGQLTLTGTLYFGIGTQSNNGLGAATVLKTNNSGEISALYNSKTLTKSFIDSGTNFLSFSDSTITQCTGDNEGFYCPATPLTISDDAQQFQWRLGDGQPAGRQRDHLP